MSKKRRSKSKSSILSSSPPRAGQAEAHRALENDFVHVFVDDQNLFWGIVNKQFGTSYRIDFGKLLLEVSKDSAGVHRPVKTAYIAGIIPDDDSFWQVARNQGFTVRRGFLGKGKRSKQDDAYLVTEITSTPYEQSGPSTIILAAGDADYVPPLKRSLEKGWRNEVSFISEGVSTSLIEVVHELRQIDPQDIRYTSTGYLGPEERITFNR